MDPAADATGIGGDESVPRVAGLSSGNRREAVGTIGYVGDPQFEERRTGWLVLLAVVLAVGVAASATRMLFTAFLPYLVVAVLIFMVLQWATRGMFGRALGGIGRIAALSRSAVPRRQPTMSQIQPFRISTADGRTVECSIAGPLDGGSLSIGDPVVVRGRKDRRSGVFITSEVRNTATGAVTTGHLSVSGRANRVALWILPIAAAWAVVAVLQAVRTLP